MNSRKPATQEKGLPGSPNTTVPRQRPSFRHGSVEALRLEEDRDGGLDVPCLHWLGDGWDLSFSWLEDDWHSGARLVSRK